MPPQIVLLEMLTHKEGRTVEKANTETLTPHFFNGAQQHMVPLLVLFALGTMSTNMPSVQHPNFGIGERSACKEMSRGDSSSSMVSQYASVSRCSQDAQTLPIPHDISVQAAENPGMELSSALRHRRTETLTPYKPSAWCNWLERHGLLGRYPNLYRSLMHGFDLGIPGISQKYVLANNPSIYKLLGEYEEIVDKEFQKGRYISPFSRADLESIIGPFQSSSLSLVPKPGKPGKFHVVHNFSHPHQTSTNSIPSITHPSASRTFPAPGECFPQYVSSFIDYPQALRPPFEMLLLNSRGVPATPVCRYRAH